MTSSGSLELLSPPIWEQVVVDWPTPIKGIISGTGAGTVPVRSGMSTIGCWSAQANTDWIQQRGPDVPSITPSGDFLADYQTACQLLGIAPHPKIVIRKIADKTDDYILQVFGFSFDLGTATALSLCLPSSIRLTRLQFWNAGLTGDVIHLLGTILRRVPTIHSLHLDWNPIIDNPKIFAELVGPDSPLKLLSLRGNRLVDADLKPILDAIGEGGQLAVLNLGSNRLTTESCAAISELLRADRTLMSLSLSHNAIGDEGLLTLLAALRPFPLNATEAKTKKFLPRGKLPSGQVSCTGNNSLKNLVCSFSGVTGRGVSDAAAALIENMTLTRLSLTNNNRIPQSVILQHRGQTRVVLDPPRQDVIEEPIEDVQL